MSKGFISMEQKVAMISFDKLNENGALENREKCFNPRVEVEKLASFP